ncbi:MAG TPA: EVE domain-containing protein [Chloroflexi bacterium]|nr:EVE domain-containing protein [Chloroflexota bacterium]
MTSELQERIQWYHAEYLDTPAGQKHLAIVEAEIEEVQRVFIEIRRKYQAGEDITEDVLRHLLPHSDTQHNREHGYRVSTWPCITKDIRTWFENTGWKEPDEWPATARMIFEAIDGILRGDEKPWRAFLESPYRRGFGTGFLSPILFCLDDQRFVVINSKVVKTYKYCTAQLGQPDDIDASLDNYLENAAKVRALQAKLASMGLRTIPEFDIFCHFMVSKRLGGGNLTRASEPDDAAWLFVANPTIFKWDQAFAENGVEWTQSLGSYAQKLLRRKIKAGDRVFGYQTGPEYEIRCELKVASAPYQTDEGTWAVKLKPVRVFEASISLATLRAHPVLSNLKFLQQTQMSITGITQAQLNALQTLLAAPEPETLPAVHSPVEAVCKALKRAQYDTSHPDRFEESLAEAFSLLGFETEHQGSPGKADIVVVGQLGAESYTAIVEAKTSSQDSNVGLAQVSYESMRDHREENAADYALLIAPAFSGGKLVDRAIRNHVSMITTRDLIALLKLHEQFPFSLSELQTLFEAKGPAADALRRLERVHTQHTEYLGLANDVLQVFDNLQRQQTNSQPIPGVAVHLILFQKAQTQSLALPELEQINQILTLLANPAIGVLKEQGSGYILILPPDAARRRVQALADHIAEGEA